MLSSVNYIGLRQGLRVLAQCTPKDHVSVPPPLLNSRQTPIVTRPLRFPGVGPPGFQMLQETAQGQVAPVDRKVGVDCHDCPQLVLRQL